MVMYLSGSVSGMTAQACRWRSDIRPLRIPVEGSLLPLMAQLGLPLAWVTQDGLRTDLVHWGAISCLFIGGTVTWKLSARARSWCEEARGQGKHVHIGKVNTFKRLRQMSQYADSVDGTYIAYGPDGNLSGLESWLNGVNQQMTLQL